MMSEPVRSVTVLVCTYNRAELLRETLAALRECTTPADCVVDILVVDNNSSDSTPEVIRGVSASPGWPIHYLIERRQGKSFALNSALAVARGDVIALTDDDVLPARDWVSRIVETFRQQPVEFVFGKVLPRWGTLPPPELLSRRARDVWGPLALIDYGDEPIPYTTAEFRRLRLPIGANLAVRRTALQHVGGWRTDLGRVDNSLVCGEDREMCVQLFRAGMYEGLYDPRLTVRHFVPEQRMSRRYFRRWYFWHGRTLARMADSFYIDLDLSHVPHVARVPRFMYRELLGHLRHWVSSIAGGDALGTLVSELHLIEYAGFFVESWRPYRPRPSTVQRREGVGDQPRAEVAVR